MTTIKRVWHGTKWFIEGDIQSCFDSIQPEILLKILQKNIQDNRFIRLIKNLLQTGYLENGRHMPTLSGTPQGVATYQTFSALPQELQGQLPVSEQIAKLLEGIE